MKLKKLLFIITASTLTVLLWAQGTPRLELTVADRKVNMTSAEEAGRVAIAYRPGDVIRYEITAENKGDGVMTEPVVTNPVPAGTVYVPLSASGKDAQLVFSINSGYTYQSWPPTYTIQDAEGNMITREATAEMVTHIRWEIKRNLAPGEKSILEFELKVK
jgi:uncharacterized repeat protein (TIGR01451 family)